MRDELFALLLRNTLIADSGFELMLTWLRCSLLQDLRLVAEAPLGFLCDLALQCFNNEFVFAVTEREAAAVEQLASAVESRLRAASGLDEPLMRSIAVLGAYRPLHTVGGIDTLLAAERPTPFDRVLAAEVANRIEEDRLRATIPMLGPIRDDLSLRVRALYEENPYPRWFSLEPEAPMTAAQWVGAELKGEQPPVAVADGPRVLVAGCGTGREAISVACGVRDAKVTAVDLSLSSLAYAKRKARELGVANIEFRQGDLLELGPSESFDLIYCVGVLHHLREPWEGLRALRRLGRPGAVLKLGLYSARSRSYVNQARQLVRERGIPATPSAIRAFRQHILAQPADSPLRGLLRHRDFFSMSECRDLLFHVQEQDFGLPQIAGKLREQNVTLLGVSNPSRAAQLAYREMFPQDKAMADPEKWDVVEQRHPQAFAGMYQFWCQLAR